jgi:hypothetical protein
MSERQALSFPSASIGNLDFRRVKIFSAQTAEKAMQGDFAAFSKLAEKYFPSTQQNYLQKNDL